MHFEVILNRDEDRGNTIRSRVTLNYVFAHHY